jgi:hypothetical protein
MINFGSAPNSQIMMSSTNVVFLHRFASVCSCSDESSSGLQDKNYPALFRKYYKDLHCEFGADPKFIKTENIFLSSNNLLIYNSTEYVSSVFR